MAGVLENIGKELLRKNKIPTPDFRVVSNAKAACKAADELGYPVVIKAELSSLLRILKRRKELQKRFC